jgi:exodeoxyribonuclease V alpha subunit
MAKRIVAAFGADTFEIIEAAPERLTEVPGIGGDVTSTEYSRWAAYQVQLLHSPSR